MKRKLGQHFLIDKNIAFQEIKYADISKDDTVLEIGPGNGIITEILADKSKKVIAIELDKKLVCKLKNLLPDNVELIHMDALKVDFKKIPHFNKIVSNLPFQISSPITFKLLDLKFDVAVLIYQKEFAERMAAKQMNKNYSRLSVNVYYKAHCEILQTISRTCFRPQPKVDSCMVKLIPRETPPFSIIDEAFFFNLNKQLFNHRRKKIKTILNKIFRVNLDDVPYLDNRIEDLSPEQIGDLSNTLFKRSVER